MSRYTFRMFVLVALALGAASGTAHAQLPKFDALYVFGDSLADNGNDIAATQVFGISPAIPPSVSPHRTYFNGRFSNGYVAPEYLWPLLTENADNAPGSAGGLKPFLSQALLPLGPAVDFGFGGTGTGYLDQTPGEFWAPGLKGQVDLYRFAKPPVRKPRRALFVIVTGANDYTQGRTIDEVVGNIVDSIGTLYRTGARDIMVLNLPDLGLVPANRFDPATGAPDPARAAAATWLSQAHNAALKDALDTLAEQMPRLHLVQPDLIDAFNSLPPTMNKTVPALAVLFSDPGVAACLFINPLTCQDSPVPFNIPLNVLFWDILHPTTEAHAFLAGYLKSSLAASYLH